MSSPTSALRRYRPGDMAPVSGIYRVTHAGPHRQPHDALVIRGEQLPPCRTCRAMVYFEVVYPISHITHEWDFSGPTPLMVKPRPRNIANVRRSPRLEVDLPVTIEQRRDGSTRKFTARSINISQCGMSATVAGLIPGDRPVRIHIALPEAQGTATFTARLRHVHGFRHGFEFVRPSPQQRRVLRQALELDF
jgi:hypothetical protein